MRTLTNNNKNKTTKPKPCKKAHKSRTSLQVSKSMPAPVIKINIKLIHKWPPLTRQACFRAWMGIAPEPRFVFCFLFGKLKNCGAHIDFLSLGNSISSGKWQKKEFLRCEVTFFWIHCAVDYTSPIPIRGVHLGALSLEPFSLKGWQN